MLRENTFSQLLQANSEAKREAIMQERQILQMEQDLSAMVWHELKNPLGCLPGTLNQVVTKLSDLQEIDLQQIASNLDTAEEILQHAIACTHGLEAQDPPSAFEDEDDDLKMRGKASYPSTPLAAQQKDLVGLLHSVATFAKPQLDEHDQVDFELALPSEPLWVMIDAKLVRQVVLNLLLNAIRLTTSGFVRLRCEVQAAHRVDGASNKIDVLIEVADSGPGLPPERLQQLTQRYGLSVGGIGLGLHTVSRLLSCLGSELEVQSPYADAQCASAPLPAADESDSGDTNSKQAKNGPGTALSFVLQLERAAPEIVGEVALSETRLPEVLDVLIADDMSMNRKLLEVVFKSVQPGWKITHASSAEDALDLVRSSSFGLVCMDEDFSHGLPEESTAMRGSEAIRLMREHERAAGTRSPAVIISITGHSWEPCEGANAAWGKPIPNHIDGSMQRELSRLLPVFSTT